MCKLGGAKSTTSAEDHSSRYKGANHTTISDEKRCERIQQNKNAGFLLCGDDFHFLIILFFFHRQATDGKALAFKAFLPVKLQ